MKQGLLSRIKHEFGDIETSQSVNAYRASMVLSGDDPAGKWIIISTFCAVLSSIFRIFIFPLSTAFRIDSIRVEVFFPKGISEMIRVLASTLLILALTLTAPPLNPSL